MKNSITIQNLILHPDLHKALKLYEAAGFLIANLFIEAESKEYSASCYELNGKSVKFRVAKITPTKIGQFVTLWKRNDRGTIIPLDLNDSFELLIVSVHKADCLGHFIFPKEILHKKGFLSKNEKGGKRAMRVYPPWDTVSSKQALETQSWQCDYFFEINTYLDSAYVQLLK
ncbi:MAG: MepB family protein [Candidatus Dependentiae bacterium]